MKTVRCHRCKYKWETKSQNFFVTCPKCRTTVKIVPDVKQAIENFIRFHQ